MTNGAGKRMPIMEVFGPTIQGEGMVVGRKTMFVRTGGCDYSCSWCDSAFTWNGEQKAKMMTAEQVFLELVKLGAVELPNLGDFMSDAQPICNLKLNFNHVTISGGNPALIGEPMAELMTLLLKNKIEVGLETQGTRWQEWFYQIKDLTISPKPPSSGMITDWDKLHEILAKLEGRARAIGYRNYTLKVVIFDELDFEFAKTVNQKYPQVPFYVSVGNADAKEEGDISGRLLQKLGWLWDKVISDPDCNNWRPLPQLHTLVWANKRGV